MVHLNRVREESHRFLCIIEDQSNAHSCTGFGFDSRNGRHFRRILFSIVNFKKRIVRRTMTLHLTLTIRVLNKHTFLSPSMYTRLVNLFTPFTSRTDPSVSAITRTWSPGTIFHHFIRSLGETALCDLSKGLGVTICFGFATGSRCRKFVVTF